MASVLPLMATLPHAPLIASAAFRELEERSRRLGRPKIFIEAPYRNDQLFASLLRSCDADTMYRWQPILPRNRTADDPNRAQWENASRAWNRRPTVFLLLAKPESFSAPGKGGPARGA